MGLKINSKLNWNTHIDYIKKKITPFLGAIKRTSYQLPPNLLSQLYFSYIQSNLMYMIPIWGTCSKYKLNSIQRLQNKAIKIVLKKPYETPTTEIFNNKFVSLSNLIKYTQCLYIYQTKNSIIRTNITIKNRTEIHDHNTRNRNNIYITNTITIKLKTI